MLWWIVLQFSEFLQILFNVREFNLEDPKSAKLILVAMFFGFCTSILGEDGHFLVGSNLVIWRFQSLICCWLLKRNSLQRYFAICLLIATIILQVFEFIVQKLHALRKPKTNIQILQQSVLLKYKCVFSIAVFMSYDADICLIYTFLRYMCSEGPW